ncbi:ER membrane protein complex subunit 6 [Atheta coriaria]|uniref:ER membrane protein complex subunit 6 n=1 Tax=Dalotia coriaria TaxID=877792 RepID=UPI0031F44DD1
MSTKNKSEKYVQPVAYSEAAIRNNATVVEYCRTSMAALSGCTAGLLGLTGLYGAAFYIFTVFLLWFMIISKAGSQFNKYFVSRRQVFTNGFFGQLFTYILCWTFLYGMVHVY